MGRPWLWLGPPAAALLGFYVIGPHYAGDSRPVRLVQEAKAVAQSRLSGRPAPSGEDPPGAKADEPTVEPAKPSDAPAPRVSVGVKPVPADKPDADGARPRRRRRHRREADSDEAPPESRPESDRNGPDPASTP